MTDKPPAPARSGLPPSLATDAQQFALLVDSVREYAIYLLDPNGQVRTWNVGGQRIKGYTPDEIIGKHFSHMFTEEDRATGKPWRLLQRAEEEGSARDEGWRMRKDGSRFWASVVLTAVRDQSGALLGFAKVSRDESERHAIEERTRLHAEELEAAVKARTAELIAQADTLRRTNEELEQFNYITSHDLQEPIRMVSMNMQKLAHRGDALSAEQRQRCMRYAQEGAERMRLLIDDLLRYNRIDRNQVAPEPTESAAAARAAVDNLAEVIARRGAEVVLGDLPVVRASSAQLTQLFQNLIENAIKYGPPEHPRVEISACDEERGWLFSVRDNGIGIEPAYHEKIFAVFQRLHSREEYPGTGMGLAICKKIVERHGGRIWVESQAGAGATFHFTVPRP